MNNKKKLTLALTALPLMMVFVTSNPAGVTVFDGQTTQMMSWLQLVPEYPWSWCAPVAALANYVIFALAVIYAVAKKEWCVKGITVLAGAAACIAVLPIIAQSEVKIVPSVFGAIILCAQWAVAYFALKKSTEEKKISKPKGKKLKKH